MFDTKIALIVRNDLATWQRLNVVAFWQRGLPLLYLKCWGNLISMQMAMSMATC